MATQEMTLSSDTMIKDLQNAQKMCEMLMKTPHYQKIGQTGIFAIVEKARSVGVNPIDALNGGIYYLPSGKVEMSSSMMAQLIRARGHSITKDKKSDETMCILHGKRKDNNDTWSESFSIEEAKKAGIYKNVWITYPKDMLFARALSRLARQLFPDIIKGCYVEGEISQAKPINYQNEEDTQDSVQVTVDLLSDEEIKYLDKMIGEDSQYRTCVMNFIRNQFNATSLNEMPRATYEKILPVAEKKYEERKTLLIMEA